MKMSISGPEDPASRRVAPEGAHDDVPKTLLEMLRVAARATFDPKSNDNCTIIHGMHGLADGKKVGLDAI